MLLQCDNADRVERGPFVAMVASFFPWHLDRKTRFHGQGSITATLFLTRRIDKMSHPGPPIVAVQGARAMAEISLP
ncbi:hypothetical protein LDDCCGHA_5783 [Methylobacterium oxalidis]|nr:hypothetical protein LDDCCGHA_5783 [Methylobacterium oxalidis]